MTPLSLPPTTRSEKFGTVLLVAFLIPFCLVSIVTAALAVRSLLEQDLGKGAFMGIFSLTFGGGSFGMMALVLEGRKRARKALALRSAHPEEPWRWRDDWATGTVRSTTKNIMLFAWGFAILWNLISSPLLFILPSEVGEKGNYAPLLGLLFPLVGVGMLVWAVRQTIEWTRFGQSVFHMTTLPGVIGGILEGSVDVPARFNPGQDFDVSISCINRRTTGSGKSTSTTEAILWQEKSAGVKSLARPEAMGAGIPVHFSIPFDCSQTDDSNPANAILWRLEAHAAVPGVDYDAKFEIPVFRTAASRPAERGNAPVEELPGGYEPTSESGISVGVGPTGGTEIIVRSRHRAGPLASMTIFFTVWTGIIVLIVMLGTPVFFAAIFGLFGILFLFIILQLAFGQSRILIEAGSVRVENAIGPFSSGTTIPVEEIGAIAPTIAMQSGKSVMYSVTLTRKSGKQVVVRCMLKEKHDAVWLAAKIRNCAGRLIS